MTFITIKDGAMPFLELGVKDRFIVVEGIDGSGKSTLVDKTQFDLEMQEKNTLVVNDPPSEILRSVLQSVRSKKDAKAAVLLLFEARKKVYKNTILPALEAGKYVVCDRFTASTYAYQGSGFGVDLDWIREVELATIGEVLPSVTLFLDVPVEVAMKRSRGRGETDAIESKGVEFFERVREGYLQYFKSDLYRGKAYNASFEDW